MKPVSIMYRQIFRKCSSTGFSSLRRFYSKELCFNVAPFGHLTSTKSCGSLKVSPLNPHEYMEQDLVVLNSDDCDITEYAHQKESHISLNGLQGNCTADIPMKFNLQLQTTGTESIHVEGLENELVDLSTEGELSLFLLKTRNVNVETISGDVTSESSVQADVNVKTQSGNVKLNKILGQSLNIEAETSDVSVDALYSFSSTVSVASGNISIKHCHHDNRLTVKNEGNIHIGTLDGSIVASVGKGNVKIQMNNPTKVDISVSSGDITLCVPDHLAVIVDLSADDFHVDDSIKQHSSLDFGRESLNDRPVCTVLKLVKFRMDILEPDWTGSVRGSAEPPSPRIRPLIQAELPRITAKTAKGTISIRKRDWLASMMEKIK
ncbi:hypothetical protein CAPTEDRAFT_214837 [Capitella teleta]|uniref:DUF4097 domain-containing protein n=1 Tax=Capitella teleta TaxID=283909 RepID=R7V1T0_CAPTE|nr:hypothetical protein CAPTEDRAFT_214837 [Capitella teleta]|eukprot:ELU12509.1 hypothetical protein CAPTEDRAFT_214837 [Capitella teleta]